jgi:hypothetical protein
MRNYDSNHSVPGGLSILALGPRKRGEINMDGLGKIQIIAERKVEMVELDIEVDDKTRDTVCHAALREITSDGDALFNYGFNQAIKRFIQTKGKKCTPKKSSSKKRSRR